MIRFISLMTSTLSTIRWEFCFVIYWKDYRNILQHQPYMCFSSL